MNYGLRKAMNADFFKGESLQAIANDNNVSIEEARAIIIAFQKQLKEGATTIPKGSTLEV